MTAAKSCPHGLAPSRSFRPPVPLFNANTRSTALAISSALGNSARRLGEVPDDLTLASVLDRAVTDSLHRPQAPQKRIRTPACNVLNGAKRLQGNVEGRFVGR